MTQFSRRSFLRSSAVIAGATIPGAGSSASLLGEFASASQKPPHLEFPTAARDKLAVASWPFRAEIESPTNEYRNQKMKGMDLREFAVLVKEKFGVPVLSRSAPTSLPPMRVTCTAFAKPSPRRACAS